MNSHQLAEILLQGEDLPVVIPCSAVVNKAEPIENIYIVENDNSPFDRCILLEGLINLEKDGFIDIE